MHRRPSYPTGTYGCVSRDRGKGRTGIKEYEDIADDMIDLYYSAFFNIDRICGGAYNIGGTKENSLSLLELFSTLENRLDVKLSYKMLPPRESDQKVFIADISRIKKSIGWQPKVSAEDGIDQMIDWIKEI